MKSSIKLTSGQAESFALLHASVCNALLYAEDLLSCGGIFKETMPPMVTKLRWLKTNIDMRIPFEKRAVQVDTLRYDEILRMLTHLSQEDLDEIERVLTESLKGEKNISSIDSSEIPLIYEYYINSTNEYLGKNPDTYEEFVSECVVNQNFFRKWYNKAKTHYESNI